ncbi:MAG: thioesterase superfamily protein [Gammaproteobacteria bacterium]|jgi:acyl-CoA thioesterase YciA|nr:thioesterase superfamily protein [Gammaproteobacteria bacterium]
MQTGKSLPASQRCPPEAAFLRIRISPTKADCNPKGDIFGGWVMSQMDLAGAIAAAEITATPISTVAVNDLQLSHPLFIEDDVHFFAKVIAIGTTSITVSISVYMLPKDAHDKAFCLIAEGIFVYVAVSAPGKKQAIVKPS